MKTKRFVLLLIVVVVAFSLIGCEKKYTPDPAVEQFLNTGLTAEKAYAAISKAAYTELRTIQDKQGNIKGTYTAEVEIDKSNPDELYLRIHQKFSGEYLDDNVEQTTSTLNKVDGSYVYTIETKFVNMSATATTSEQLSDDDAATLVQSIIYSNNEVYDEGLYYGDLFMLRIYKYPAECFYVDTEANLCVFDGKIYVKQESTGNMRLYQTTKINALGLLVSTVERYESVPNDYVMTCEITPTYEYVTAD